MASLTSLPEQSFVEHLSKALEQTVKGQLLRALLEEHVAKFKEEAEKVLKEEVERLTLEELRMITDLYGFANKYQIIWKQENEH